MFIFLYFLVGLSCESVVLRSVSLVTHQLSLIHAFRMHYFEILYCSGCRFVLLLLQFQFTPWIYNFLLLTTGFATATGESFILLFRFFYRKLHGEDFDKVSDIYFHISGSKYFSFSFCINFLLICVFQRLLLNNLYVFCVEFFRLPLICIFLPLYK